MNNKLPASLASLKSWSEQILANASGREWRLSNFADAFNMGDYMQFYRELLPFVQEIDAAGNPMLAGFVRTYAENGALLEEAMQEGWLAGFFIGLYSDMPFVGRRADDLIEAIRQVRGNAENLELFLRTMQA